MICVLLFLGDRGDLCQLFMQQPVVLEAMQRVFACLLVTLLLGVTFSAGTFKAIDDDLRVEERRAVLCFGFCQQNILQGDFVFLTPFQQFAFEVHLLIGHLVQINEAMQDFFCEEILAVGISPVQIDGANECLERISGQIAVVHLVVLVAPDEFVEAYLSCQFAQRFALHNFAAGIRQKTFALAGEMVIYNLSHNSTQDSIAQELQPFVVEWCAALGVCQHRLMHQCFLIEADIVRVEPHHLTKSAIKLLFLAEGKLYRVY